MKKKANVPGKDRDESKTIAMNSGLLSNEVIGNSAEATLELRKLEQIFADEVKKILNQKNTSEGQQADAQIESLRKRAGGPKTSRSETVTVRLEPQVRYLAELAGRKQRRTLSSFIEWAIQKGLEHVNLEERTGNSSIANLAHYLWDVDEADRFIKLAIKHSDLLTHDEQVLWKLVRENGWLWRGSYENSDRAWQWDIREDYFNFERFRDNWALFNDVAKGVLEKSALPTWAKIEPDYFDPKEIPF